MISSQFPPTIKQDPPPNQPVLTTLPGVPETVPQLGQWEGKFPSGPPKPQPSSIPPPLAPAGRWLHTAVMIDGSLYIYGGVGSYSTALYNDLWLYNYEEGTWAELQASFVPPFPLPDKRKGMAKLPNEAIDQFRPGTDAPPSPPMADEPVPKLKQLPVVKPTAEMNPIALPAKTKPIPVVDYKPPRNPPMKAPGFSLLEILSRVESTSRSQHTTVSKLDIRHQHLLNMHMQMHAQTQEPPKFWKSNSLSPGLLSPFIAADLWMYDTETKRWFSVKSSSAQVPAPRWLHSAVSIGGRMLVFGGVSYSDIILGDVWLFNPDDSSWIKAAPIGDNILPREGHSACVAKDTQMWVFGGISYGHIPFNDLWMYDSTRNEWAVKDAKGITPPPRWLHSASTFQDSTKKESIIIFGGVTRNWIPLNDLWVLDLEKLEWTHPHSVGLPPFPRMMHGAGIIKDKLFVHAGIANNIPFEDLWTYDLSKNLWNEENEHGAYPFAREGHSLTVVCAPPKAEGAGEATRPPYMPPPPAEDQLMPLIKNTTSARDLNRFRKDYTTNCWFFTFGGAGPKPRETD